jgi:uncharacterized membrane protein YidH (DUF202 family)
MNRSIGIVLLIGGVAAMVLGICATNSFSSDVSRFYTGSPTDKAIWLLLAGIVVSVVGLVGTLRNWKQS